MSGIFGSSQWMYSSAAGFYGHEISQSLRFEDGDNAHLDRTMSSGNRKTFTHSVWFKRGNLGSRQISGESGVAVLMIGQALQGLSRSIAACH